jgi:hypothetical protein
MYNADAIHHESTTLYAPVSSVEMFKAETMATEGSLPISMSWGEASGQPWRHTCEDTDHEDVEIASSGPRSKGSA